MPDGNAIPFQSPTTGAVQPVVPENWDEALKLGYKPTQHTVMYDPQGNRGMVPNEQLKQYAQQGYQTTPQTQFEKEQGRSLGQRISDWYTRETQIPNDPYAVGKGVLPAGGTSPSSPESALNTTLGMSTAMTFPAALVEAPLATAGTLGGSTALGYGADKTARYTAKRLNPQDPEAGNIAGPVAGFFGGLAGGTIGGIGGSSLDERIVPWANKAIPNFLASKLRYPATARQSQIAGEVAVPGEFVPGKPGTVKSFLPSFLQRYTVSDEMIPRGEIGTPTNPGPFEQIPSRLPKGMQGDPFNPSAPITTGGAQKPFEPLIYSSETEPEELERRAANLKRQASSTGMYHAAQGSVAKRTNLQQRIAKKYTPWGNP